MATYYTPGVYVEEIAKFPPSVVAVATAIPAFIGYTELHTDNEPVRITSLLEFETFFGGAYTESLSVDVEQTIVEATRQVIATKISFTNLPPPILASRFLYYAMRLFFDNGGGPCYVVSIGDFQSLDNAPLAVEDFTYAINLLESYDEPTLLVFPDACLGTAANVNSIVEHALTHCSKMQDRFVIADIPNAVPDPLKTTKTLTDEVSTAFRAIVADLEQLKYGAAYFPFLNTKISFYQSDNSILVKKHTIYFIQTGGVVKLDNVDLDPNDTSDPRNANNDFIINGKPISDATVKDKKTSIYNATITFIINNTTVTIPSGAIAGVYARVDKARGVWKAPANVGINNIFGPALTITDEIQESLNIDSTGGKSINVIRSFTGKGTLVWGARTLAGNDNEWRYVPVRRLFIMVEESVKKATANFVFEPNDANTWIKVRSMIENFLTLQWRAGALAGAKPEEAFFVKVGLNVTMSAQDILDGYLIVEIGLAAVRPAEFIILRFSHKMQES